MNFIELLDYNTTQVHAVKYEVLGFMRIVENYFKFTPNMVERLEYIYKISIQSIPYFCHKIRYENVILGIAIYVMDEFDEMQSSNIIRFIEYLYKDDVKSNTIHIYRARNTIDNFFNN